MVEDIAMAINDEIAENLVSSQITPSNYNQTDYILVAEAVINIIAIIKKGIEFLLIRN